MEGERRKPPYTIKAVLYLWPEHDPSAGTGLVPINNRESAQAKVVPLIVEPNTKRIVGYR